MMAHARSVHEGGFYLYAIVPADAGANILEKLGDGFQLIAQGPFAAVARATAEASYSGHDRQELVRLLLSHQQAIESIMVRAPVLPVKFATVAPDRESVERCLVNAAAKFAEAFAQLAGKTQFEVMVTWDLDEVFAKIARSSEVICLKSELAATGQVGQAASIRLGTAVKRLLDQQRGAVSERLSVELGGVAIDTIDNALMDDRMVLNLALLIDQDHAAALDRCLEALDAAYDGKLNFRCVGPTPPHSFATVEVSFLDIGKISWARGVLELDEVADAEEVRAAYRRLARRTHPDSRGEQASGNGMSILHDAYKTLCAYVETGGPELVAVRRQEARASGSAGYSRSRQFEFTHAPAPAAGSPDKLRGLGSKSGAL